MASDAEISALEAATGQEADCLFLELMIRHHEGAIPMAEAVLELGSEPRVLAVAQSIKAGQTAEIDAMESMQAAPRLQRLTQTAGRARVSPRYSGRVSAHARRPARPARAGHDRGGARLRQRAGQRAHRHPGPPQPVPGASRAQVLPVSLLGAAIILFGLLTLAVASGLARGSRLRAPAR